MILLIEMMRDENRVAKLSDNMLLQCNSSRLKNMFWFGWRWFRWQCWLLILVSLNKNDYLFQVLGWTSFSAFFYGICCKVLLSQVNASFAYTTLPSLLSFMAFVAKCCFHRVTSLWDHGGGLESMTKGAKAATMEKITSLRVLWWYYWLRWWETGELILPLSL